MLVFVLLYIGMLMLLCTSRVSCGFSTPVVSLYVCTSYGLYATYGLLFTGLVSRIEPWSLDMDDSDSVHVPHIVV